MRSTLQRSLIFKRLSTFCVVLSLFTCGASDDFLPHIDTSKFDDNFPSFPTGHLKPFGHQKPPDGPVKEYFEVLRPELFWEKHVKEGIPLVFRQAIGKSPALYLWTDEYLRENYGDLDVLIELKEENRSHSARRMSIAEFLSRYKEEDVYIVTVLPDPMRREVQVPQCLLCGTFRDYIHETNFWMSSGGTRSVIHYDADHNLHCLVAGRKDFIMIEKQHYKHLYFKEKGTFSGSGFSEINPNKINLLDYPNVAKVPWTYATIFPGDCIYIPSGHIHQVRSYNRTISATMLFTAGQAVGGSFHPNGCDQETFNYTSLSEVDVHWTYKKGDKVIEMGYMNLEELRDSLLSTLKVTGSDILTEEMFVTLWNEIVELQDGDDRHTGDPRNVFRSYLDIHGKGYLTKNDMLNVSMEALKNVARVMDPPHGPVAGKMDGNSTNNDYLHKEL